MSVCLSVVATWYFISPSPPSLYNHMYGAVLGKNNSDKWHVKIVVDD